jgi:hypothetical protein
MASRTPFSDKEGAAVGAAWPRRCDTLRRVTAEGSAPGSEAGSTSGKAPAERGERFILDQLTDRLETLRLLREDDPQRAGVMLEQFGASGRVESQMLTQLGQRQPLQIPDRFPEAHRTVMRAVEVFDRNAGRRPSSLRAGALRPAASLVVQLLIGVVVRNYQRSVIQHLRRLYALRQANSVPGSVDYRMLTLATRQLDRVTADLSRRSSGLPPFRG